MGRWRGPAPQAASPPRPSLAVEGPPLLERPQTRAPHSYPSPITGLVSPSRGGATGPPIPKVAAVLTLHRTNPMRVVGPPPIPCGGSSEDPPTPHERGETPNPPRQYGPHTHQRES